MSQVVLLEASKRLSKEEIEMKKTSTGVLMAIMISATSVSAGGMAEPVMAPEVIAEESSASSGGFLVPLVLLAVLVALVSNSGSEAAPAPTCLVSCS